MSVEINSFNYRVILKPIIMLLLMMSPLAFLDNRSEFVCSKFHKNVFEKYGLPSVSVQPERHQWLWAVSDIDNIDTVDSVIGNKLIEKLSEIRDWVTDLTLSECYPNSMLCEMNWRPNLSESLIADYFAENYQFNNGEFGYNASTLSRLLTDYHVDRPYYGLPASGLFGGSSYNSSF